jgi:alkylhydroperoxidase family enzyme
MGRSGPPMGYAVCMTVTWTPRAAAHHTSQQRRVRFARICAAGGVSMSRVPYVPGERTENESELVSRIRARRGGKLLNLDRMLLNSPSFAQGWNSHLGAVRRELLLDPKLRELAVCAIAVLNGADYEWGQHTPEFLRAGGTAAQVEALARFGGEAADTATFNATERAVLQLALEMTRNVQVSDSTFERVQSALSDTRQVVELVGVIATYNMVSRFLVALEVDLE